MSIGTLIHRHPMRSAASAILDAERAISEAQRQVRTYPTLRFAAEQSFAPYVSAVENEDAYLITAELPGVDASDLEVIVEDGVLTIKGQRYFPGYEKASETAGEADTDEAADEKDARGRFQRRYRFNGDIDDEAVQAKLKNGLLTVSVPKRKLPEPEVRSIPVEVS